MATTEAVQRRLTQILVQVVDCAPQDVVPNARLNQDLGVDSLSIVEVCERLGPDFGVYISDEAINKMVTVGDAVDAVIQHGGAATVPASAPAAAVPVTEKLFGAMSDEQLEQKKKQALGLAGRMAIVGLAIGLLLALAAVAVVNASGINELEPPQAATPTATIETTTPPSAEPTPTSSPTPTEETAAAPELTASPIAASPGQQIVLEGTFEEVGAGASLQVQVKDPNTGWDDFPVTTKTGDDGEFRTIVRTTRTGERQFRLFATDAGKATPAVKVTIG